MSEERLEFTELGKTGLNRWGGVVQEEWLSELSGQKAVRVYKEMRDNDPIVGAILFAIEMLCRRATWRIEPGGNTDEDKRARDFLETCFQDMSQSWENTVSEILSFLVFGWSYFEIVYKLRKGDNDNPSMRSKYNDGRVGWRKFAIRAQETLYKWEFDEEGGIKGMWQIASPDYAPRFIPIEKSLLFRTKVIKGSPEGRSILRNAYRPWFYKKNIETIEAIGVERDLAGLPVVWVPPNVAAPRTTEERAAFEAFKRLVTGIRRDQKEGIIMPLVYDESGKKLYDLTLLSTGGSRQFDTGEIISRYDLQIAQTVLADFIKLGSEKVGSYALAVSKTSIFTMAISAFLGEIASVMNTYAIPRLFRLNKFNVKEYPRLTHSEIKDINLEEISKFISNLSGAGAELFPDEDLENYLRQIANLPLRPRE